MVFLSVFFDFFRFFLIFLEKLTGSTGFLWTRLQDLLDYFLPLRARRTTEFKYFLATTRQSLSESDFTEFTESVFIFLFLIDFVVWLYFGIMRSGRLGKF